MLQEYHDVSGGVHVEISGPGCSKLTTSLVNVSLRFQTLNVKYLKYANIFFEKMGEAFAVQKLLSFFQQKMSVYLVKKS